MFQRKPRNKKIGQIQEENDEMSWFEKYQTYSHETSPKILELSMVKYFNFTT